MTSVRSDGMWKNVILLRFDGLVIALSSIWYGFTLITNPEMLEQYKTYEVINRVLQDPFLAYAFLIFGVLKILGIILNNRLLKIASIFALFFLWTMFTTSFFIMHYYYGFPTSLGGICLIPALISGKIAISEV